jgi:tRNA (guanine-N7-)-methyltransferase
MTLPPSDPSDSPAAHRPIRSFVRRNGRLGTGQARAMSELAPRFVLPYTPGPLNAALAFGSSAPLILEIGFGMGETTAAIAAGMPERNFLGLEVHQAGVGALLKRIGEQRLDNVRIIEHDAVEVVANMIAPGSLAGIHVFFPDPWHKKRHNKRRLLQAGFVRELALRLATGGYLHCATDWQEYALQILATAGAEPLLKNTAPGFAEKPAYRPMTKFENRGIKLGHGVWDVVFTRSG